MSHPNSVFAKQTDTIKHKVKRLALVLAVYIPLMGLVLGMGWYINKQMPIWVSHYFNVASAQKMADLTNARVQIAEQAMSFPIGVSAYVTAQIDSMTASTKAVTLSFASRMTCTLLQGITYLFFLLLSIWVIFKSFKSYTVKSSEERIARNVVNMLLPVLEEMNNNSKK